MSFEPNSELPEGRKGHSLLFQIFSQEGIALGESQGAKEMSMSLS